MSEKKESTKKRKTINWLLVFTLLVFAIPSFILAKVLIDSQGETRHPVVEDRFKNQLSPKISNSQIDEIRKNINFQGIEEGKDKVEVNLISATLRITIETKDDLYMNQIDDIANKTYDEVNKVLPINKYFTNHNGVKMYDLEIHVYDYLPEDNKKGNPFYVVYTKNAASKKLKKENVREPKNKEVTEQMLKSTDELKKKTQNQKVVAPVQ